MIAVVIISLLAALALPAAHRAGKNARHARFMNDLRMYRDAVETCRMETGIDDLGAGSGLVHPLLAEYFDPQRWAAPTPIGGQWDVEYEKSGVRLAVGVHGYEVSDDELLEIDARYDVGNLAAGNMRKIANDRYYWVIED